MKMSGNLTATKSKQRKAGHLHSLPPPEAGEIGEVFSVASFVAVLGTGVLNGDSGAASARIAAKLYHPGLDDRPVPPPANLCKRHALG